MKQLISIAILCFLSTFSQNALATVLNNNVPNTTHVTTIENHKKQSFIEKLIEKRLLYKAKQANVQKKDDAQSQGDKLAKIGLISTVSGVSTYILLFLAFQITSSLGIVFLLFGILAPLALLMGLILSIIALTGKDLTRKGKKNAKTALWLVGGFLVLYIAFFYWALSLGD